MPPILGLSLYCISFLQSFHLSSEFLTRQALRDYKLYNYIYLERLPGKLQSKIFQKVMGIAEL